MTKLTPQSGAVVTELFFCLKLLVGLYVQKSSGSQSTTNKVCFWTHSAHHGASAVLFQRCICPENNSVPSCLIIILQRCERSGHNSSTGAFWSVWRKAMMISLLTKTSIRNRKQRWALKMMHPCQCTALVSALRLIHCRLNRAPCQIDANEVEVWTHSLSSRA